MSQSDICQLDAANWGQSVCQISSQSEESANVSNMHLNMNLNMTFWSRDMLDFGCNLWDPLERVILHVTKCHLVKICAQAPYMLVQNLNQIHGVPV